MTTPERHRRKGAKILAQKPKICIHHKAARATLLKSEGNTEWYRAGRLLETVPKASCNPCLKQMVWPTKTNTLHPASFPLHSQQGSKQLSSPAVRLEKKKNPSRTKPAGLEIQHQPEASCPQFIKTNLEEKRVFSLNIAEPVHYAIFSFSCQKLTLAHLQRPGVGGGQRQGSETRSTDIYVNFHATVRPATIPLHKLQH